MTVRPGQTAVVHTDSTQAVDGKPAFPILTATLSPTKTAGTLELVTRASQLEFTRNKKGKVRIRKRNLGALVPIRAGETQLVSSPSDPIQLQVHLERE